MSLRRPSGHGLVLFAGFAGITRTVLDRVAYATDVRTALAIYTGCLVLAVVTGRKVRNARGERTARMISGSVSTIGFMLSVAAHHMPRFAPLAVTLGIAVLTMAGELLYKRYRIKPARH